MDLINESKNNASPEIVPRTVPQPPQATWAQRIAVMAAIRFRKLFDKSGGTVMMLTKHICVKRSAWTRVAEAATMLFVAQNSKVPVPRVYCVFERKGLIYIVMERVQGHMMGLDWHARPQALRDNLLAQLKRHVQDLRSIPRDGPMVKDVNGGPVLDGRIGRTMTHGPFDSVHDFHDHLRHGLKYDPKFGERVGQLYDLHDQHEELPVFTHGDLSSLNVIVKDDQVVGIVDWETAGWLPLYWEYTTACQVNIRNLWWRDEVDKFLEPMPDALTMESLRQEFFGDTN